MTQIKTVAVLDIKGKAAGKLNLNEEFFTGKINTALLHQTVSIYLKNQRQGSASTKTRGQIRGGGRKPWRQKGTGRARAGSIRSPIWRGGGTVFGPMPKDYHSNIPKSVKNLSLAQSLNAKLKDNDLIVVEDISFAQSKTKEFAMLLKNLKVKVKEKSLVVVEKREPNVIKSARNIASVTLKLFSDINALDVLSHKKVIFSKQALENLVKMRTK